MTLAQSLFSFKGRINRSKYWTIHPYLGLSVEEEKLMQSMAEHYLQQGIAQGIEQATRDNENMAEHYFQKGIEQATRDNENMAEHYLQEGRQEGEKRGTIEGILALLNMRFETEAVAALRPALEAIDDLQVLREVLLEVPESENLEAFRRTLSS